MAARESGPRTLPPDDRVRGIFILGGTMQNLQRKIHIGFRVTEEEQELIRQARERAGFSSLRAYLLKMAVNGYVISIDLRDVRECSRLLRILGNNVNQLARRANAGGNIYASDIEDIQTQLDNIWTQQNKIIRDLSKVLEAA